MVKERYFSMNNGIAVNACSLFNQSSECKVWFDGATKKRKRYSEGSRESRTAKTMALMVNNYDAYINRGKDPHPDLRKASGLSNDEEIVETEHSDSGEKYISSFKRIRFDISLQTLAIEELVEYGLIVNMCRDQKVSVPYLQLPEWLQEIRQRRSKWASDTWRVQEKSYEAAEGNKRTRRASAKAPPQKPFDVMQFWARAAEAPKYVSPELIAQITQDIETDLVVVQPMLRLEFMQAMCRNTSDIDMNGQGTRTPSRSKRQRVDDVPFSSAPDMVPNDEDSSGMPSQTVKEDSAVKTDNLLTKNEINTRRESNSQFTAFLQQKPTIQQTSIQTHTQNLAEIQHQ